MGECKRNREIKFRIREKDRLSLDDASYIQISPLREECVSSMLTIYKGDIVEQYTGLKDKNGIEIYEGDIIKIDVSRTSHKKTIDSYVVVWNEDIALGHGWGAWNLDGGGYLPVDGIGIYEVIGNKYENPELSEK